MPTGEAALRIAELDKALREGATILRAVVVEGHPATDCTVFLLLDDRTGWHHLAHVRGGTPRAWAQSQRVLRLLRSRTQAEICFHPARSDTLRREGIPAP